MEKEILSATMTTVTPLIQSIVEVYVTPKLKMLRDKDKNNKLPKRENFTEYFHRTFKRLAVMNTLVFHNSQLLLTDIYIPLSIRQIKKQQDSVSNKIKIDNFPQKLSDEFNNILITDTAGMGKSTMMKKIFISAIYERSGIPLFIELRRLNKSKKLLDEIQEQLNSLEKDFDKQLLLELLAQGDFIIILDGYDEITLIDKEVVTTDIQEFISKASNNRFFITSRPENALSCFGGFQEFRIEPLSKNEAFTLLRKYDNQGKVSSLLIEKLKEKEMGNIGDFLTNPLLVTLLFTAFEYKQTIPLKKHLFYRQVFDSNFEMHDLTKGDSFIHEKKSKLQIDDFDRVLRYLSFYCFKQQKIEFSKDELLQLITKSKNFCVGLNFTEHDFLDDLIQAVPLFTKDGNYYRWAHKSLHEYFAAKFIFEDAKEKQNDILLGIYNNSQIRKFINVLDLYYDMDYKTFRNVIEFNLLKEYYEYHSNFYNKVYEGVLEKDVIMRKQLMFFFEKSYIVQDNEFNDKHISETMNKLKCSRGFHTSKCNNLSLLYSLYDKRVYITQLLLNKKNSISQSLVGNNKITITYQFQKDCCEKEITDEICYDLNSPINFKEINKLLTEILAHPLHYAAILTHSTAIEKYEEIKASIETEKRDDLLESF